MAITNQLVILFVFSVGVASCDGVPSNYSPSAPTPVIVQSTPVPTPPPVVPPPAVAAPPPAVPQNCTYIFLSPSYLLSGAEGRNTAIGVKPSPAGCRWTAESGADWITIVGAKSGSGDGRVSLHLDRYDGVGLPRRGKVWVSNEYMQIEQVMTPGIGIS